MNPKLGIALLLLLRTPGLLARTAILSLDGSLLLAVMLVLGSRLVHLAHSRHSELGQISVPSFQTRTIWQDGQIASLGFGLVLVDGMAWRDGRGSATEAKTWKGVVQA